MSRLGMKEPGTEPVLGTVRDAAEFDHAFEQWRPQNVPPLPGRKIALALFGLRWFQVRHSCAESIALGAAGVAPLGSSPARGAIVAGLSILNGGVFIVCANPIFPILGSDRDVLVFEVLQDDARFLKLHLGEIESYCLDDAQPFKGELISLEVRRSTHPRLAVFKEKRTMRGVLKIHSGAPLPVV
jgi:hypothetical protein